MAELFSEKWMQRFKEEWNKESELAQELSNIKFNSTIGYGFDDEQGPMGVLIVEKGKVVFAGGYVEQDLQWDLRASKSDWQKWFANPPGMMSLGMAYTARKLKFLKGDYTAMIKDPRMAGPFLRSFVVMSRI